MHRYIIHLLAAALIVGSAGLLVNAAQKGKAAKKDQKSLQGTWTAKKGPFSAVMIIKGKRYTFKMDDGNEKVTAFGTFKIDPSKTPKTINMKVTKGKGEKIKEYVGKTAHGIYKVNGDTLTWCSNEPGKEGRPKAFAENDGQHLLLMFQRKKK